MQIQPQTYFTIVRQIGDHTDNTLYYLQAVIRNARTDEIIDKVNLDHKEGQRYSKPWQVPADPTGLGFYISIVTSVYTDPERMTKSIEYADEAQEQLIKQEAVSHGGGGVSVDYKRIEKALERIVDEKIAGIKLPKATDVTPVAEKIEEVEAKILAAMRNIPQTDLSQVLGDIQGVLQAVRAIEIPEQKETDLTPVIDTQKHMLSLIETEMENRLDEMEKTDKKTAEQTASFIRQIVAIRDELKAEIEEMKGEAFYITQRPEKKKKNPTAFKGFPEFSDKTL